LSRSTSGTRSFTASRLNGSDPPEEAHRVCAPREKIALRIGVKQVEDAALAHHRIEIQLRSRPSHSFREYSSSGYCPGGIVGADGGGVAPDVAEPIDPSPAPPVGNAVFVAR